MKIGLVGEGARFDAILALLRATEAEFGVWHHPGAEGAVPADAPEVELDAFTDAPLIFVALPMSELRPVARALGDVLTGRHCVVHACHAVERGSLHTASHVLCQETPTRRIGFLTGPMASDEVREGLPASAVCATRFPELCELVDEALVHPGFRVYRTRDILGAELAAAYTRVIAMAAGVGYEMKLGLSVQATLFSRGLAEASRFVASRGATERTTFGIAGSANLRLDTTPPGSVDFRVGAHAVGRGAFDRDEIADTFGGTGRDLLHLVESLWGGVAGTPLDAHILQACQNMVSGESQPHEAVAHLMTLPTLDD